MSRVKVRLADNIARIIFIEKDATIGAQLGTDLRMPDGTLATAAKLNSYLGNTDTTGVGVTDHRLLRGLNLGDDHPQYTRKDTLTTRGDLYVRGASTVVRLPLGPVDQILRSDGTDVDWYDADANPSAQVGLTAVNGTTNTFMRSDAAPALDQNISPSWTGDHEFTGIIDVGGELLLSGLPGTAGQVLTSNGAGLVPTWEDSSGGGGLAYINLTIPGGNTVANSSAETAFASSYDVAGGTLMVGSVLRMRLWGTYGTDAAVAPTLRVRVKLDAVTILDTTAITTLVGATNRGWFTDVQCVVRSVGASGTVDSQALVELSTALATALVVNVPNTSTATIDTTVDQTVSVTVQWGTADADNTITLRQMAIWIDPAPSAPASAVFTRMATFTRGNAGTVELPVSAVPLVIPVACTITRVTVLTIGGTGSCVLDIRKDVYANYPPTVGDSICGSSKPTIAAGIKYEDTALVGWTTAVAAGDTLIFNLDSTAIFSSIVIILELTP